MKEFIEKLNKRLEEIKDDTGKSCSKVDFKKCHQYEHCGVCLVDRIMDIVNELAEEHKDKSGIIDDVKSFLQEKFDYCAEQVGMNLEAECNSEIESYFRERKELYLDRANIYGEVMREIDRLAEEHNGGWINVKDGLPEKNVFVLATTKNVGMTVVKHIDKVRFGCVEYEWTNSRTYWRAEDVIAWQPLPEPYIEK